MKLVRVKRLTYFVFYIVSYCTAFVSTSGCGGTMTSVSGEIISPGYPNPYHHMADCYWYIRVSEGSRVNFHITDIDMESAPACVYDYVEVLLFVLLHIGTACYSCYYVEVLHAVRVITWRYCLLFVLLRGCTAIRVITHGGTAIRVITHEGAAIRVLLKHTLT